MKEVFRKIRLSPEVRLGMVLAIAIAVVGAGIFYQFGLAIALGALLVLRFDFARAIFLHLFGFAGLISILLFFGALSETNSWGAVGWLALISVVLTYLTYFFSQPDTQRLFGRWGVLLEFIKSMSKTAITGAASHPPSAD